MHKTWFVLVILLYPGLSMRRSLIVGSDPADGWNSWNKFAVTSRDADWETADACDQCMKDAGYQYIVIDDCWHGARDKLGFIQPD